MIQWIKSLYRWSIGLLYIGPFLMTIYILSFFLARHRLEPVLKAGIRFLFRLLFIRVDVEGLEHIKPDQNYFIMANHVSLFDVPLLEGYIPINFIGIAAYHQFNWPIYGWVLKRLGHIPMVRENPLSAKKSYEKAIEYLQKGESIALMPEGHRTLTGKMGNFKRFPFYIAKKAGVPILPVGLSGLFTLKSKNSWHIRGDYVKLKIAAPISTETIQHLSETDLMQLTKEKIQSLIEFH